MELEIEMEAKQQKLEKLQALVNGPLASSIAKLSGCSRTIPSEEDFHFYYNFGEFKDPVKQISQKSQSVLKTLGGSSLLTKQLVFPEDIDDAYDWLVDVNDQLFERFDVSIDEFRKRRKEQEEESENGGFQLVEGKKKKEQAKMTKASSSGAQKRVPFHIPSIPRPQDEYKIVVDNSNKPFEHVWLEKSEDGSRFIHPLEKFSELDFVDKIVGDLEPVKPLPIECTPFKIVEKVEELKELASKLCDVNEFAVDLEHNHYRSFQGLTCLMQISTRTEDFVVDTLKLRAHIGPYLRDIFKDPSKKKVMHGADRDILWLQQDFSIYVCNMFDTGQASKILQLERNSLEFLLNHFCGITANKVYQNADWRLRPIPDEMLKYAREDTHYLLYIYDLMRVKLLEASIDDETGEARLAEVYKRSYAICMQLYEKEILTESSYLYIYGLHGADFNSQQVAIAAGLCEWRDTVARAEDESTGFILPNKALLDIARLMPLTSGKLRGLVKFKHPYVERNLGAVVSIIKRSIQNAPAYESAAELLKMDRTEMAAAMNMVVADESEVISAPEDPTVNQVHDQSEAHDDEDGNRIREQAAECVPTSAHVKEEQFDGTPSECGNSGPSSSFNILHRELSKESLDDSEQMGSSNKKTPVTEATIQVLKKPSRAFGALLGKSGSKKKLGLDSTAQIKVEQIKASVTFQFHSFPERSEQPERLTEEINKSPISPHPKGPVSPTADTNRLEEIIPLENDSEEEALDSAPTAAGDSSENSKTSELASSDHGGTPMSLTELSSNFEECVDTMNKKRNTGKNKKCQEPDILQLNPFDYSAARTQTVLGDQKEKRETKDDDVKNLQHSKDKRRKGSIIGGPGDEGTRDFPSVRRRQAFPNTGNRGATFR